MDGEGAKESALTEDSIFSRERAIQPTEMDDMLNSSIYSQLPPPAGGRMIRPSFKISLRRSD